MINIPPISSIYIKTLKIYLMEIDDPYDLYSILNTISIYIQSVDIVYDFNGLGGSKTIIELHEETESFKKETILEYDKLKKHKYNAVDFIHIFLDGYYLSITELILEKKLNRRYN